jgi:hypothetical protein
VCILFYLNLFVASHEINSSTVFTKEDYELFCVSERDLFYILHFIFNPLKTKRRII